MSAAIQPAGDQKRLNCQPVRPARKLPSLAEDVREGLLAKKKQLSPKYFYDDHGSLLFDAICDTREYYPARTEDALLKSCADDIISTFRPAHIVELGSGVARKTRRLLDACEEHECYSTYWPFDVCESIVRGSAENLIDKYEWLNVNGLVGDYHAGFDHFPELDGCTLYVFLGGTIGNFEHDKAVKFLAELRDAMAEDDILLIGADRLKDEKLLHAAYNDSDGITAAFNLNILRVLNREVDANFEIDGFRHHAFFNDKDLQIEMHLVATRQQKVRLNALDEEIEFAKGESILTEISRKFTPESLDELLTEAGFCMYRHYEPDNGYFSLILAKPQSA